MLRKLAYKNQSITYVKLSTRLLGLRLKLAEVVNEQNFYETLSCNFEEENFSKLTSKRLI